MHASSIGTGYGSKIPNDSQPQEKEISSDEIYAHDLFSLDSDDDSIASNQSGQFTFDGKPIKDDLDEGDLYHQSSSNSSIKPEKKIESRETSPLNPAASSSKMMGLPSSSSFDSTLSRPMPFKDALLSSSSSSMHELNAVTAPLSNEDSDHESQDGLSGLSVENNATTSPHNSDSQDKGKPFDKKEDLHGLYADDSDHESQASGQYNADGERILDDDDYDQGDLLLSSKKYSKTLDDQAESKQSFPLHFASSSGMMGSQSYSSSTSYPPPPPTTSSFSMMGSQPYSTSTFYPPLPPSSSSVMMGSQPYSYPASYPPPSSFSNSKLPRPMPGNKALLPVNKALLSTSSSSMHEPVAVAAPLSLDSNVPSIGFEGLFICKGRSDFANHLFESLREGKTKTFSLLFEGDHRFSGSIIEIHFDHGSSTCQCTVLYSKAPIECRQYLEGKMQVVLDLDLIEGYDVAVQRDLQFKANTFREALPFIRKVSQLNHDQAFVLEKPQVGVKVLIKMIVSDIPRFEIKNLNAKPLDDKKRAAIDKQLKEALRSQGDDPLSNLPLPDAPVIICDHFLQLVHPILEQISNGTSVCYYYNQWKKVLLEVSLEASTDMGSAQLTYTCLERNATRALRQGELKGLEDVLEKAAISFNLNEEGSSSGDELSLSHMKV